MVKKRVHELAKELNIESKDIIRGMSQLGVNLKSHMSTMEDGEIELYLKNYHGKTASIKSVDSVGDQPKPPAAAPAERNSEPAGIKGAGQRPESPSREPSLTERTFSDKRRQEKRDYRNDRGPGLVDRVPSRPPDRRFEDRSARSGMAPKASYPSAPPQRPSVVKKKEAQQPPQTPKMEERPAEKTPAPSQQQAPAKERPRYPDRQRPAAMAPLEQHRDNRPPVPGRDRPGDINRPAAEKDRKFEGRPAGERGIQSGRGTAQTGDRPRFDGPKGPRFGEGVRPGAEDNAQRTAAGRPPAGRPAQGRPSAGRPAQGRPSAGIPAQGRPSAGRGPGASGGPRPAFAAGGKNAAASLKVPKVPDQAKGVDKIKASEKSRSRLQQAQANKGKNRERSRQEMENEIRGLRPGGRKKGNQQKARHEQPKFVPPQEKKPIVIGETVTVQELAEKMKKSPAELIKKLMGLGIMATINQEIDSDTAIILASEFDFEVEVKIQLDAEALMEMAEEDNPEDLISRPCVVTIMGHVDHGKTSLLDAIRETNVIATEAGGITQHIGAYQVEHNNKKITFVDTPGHEAFTAMRARGSSVTDIVVLVVAADDGVMPQTIEAINHAKAAEVPIIVAINKMDKPGANPDRVKQQLTEYSLIPEEWGGETICVPVSAKARMGLEDLLESILLVAEVSELKANPKKEARGTVIEAELDKGRGPVATVLVQNGTLNIGDGIVAGTAFGKVRAMIDDKGRRIKKAGPSTPVEVLGFHDVPQAGDAFYVVNDEKVAKQIIEKRMVRKRQEELKVTVGRVTLEDLFKHIQEGQVKELCLIVKADVQGSVEAINQSLARLSTDEVKVNIIHSGVGAIRETDIMLASASNAIIIGFNVRPDVNARRIAEEEKVDVRLYRVIYDAIDDIKAAMSGLLDPELREVVTGRLEIRKIFKASKLGTIAGCYVTEGKVTKDAGVRLIRDGIVIYEGKMDSLKRFKDDVKEVVQGYECGMTLENYQDIREGDIVEAFTTEKIKRELA
ncbi:MAG: translation initiation factor IF-2 [Bacillota bacterium]